MAVKVSPLNLILCSVEYMIYRKTINCIDNVIFILDLSLPTSPVHSPEKVSIAKDVDVMRDIEFTEVIPTEDFKFNFENHCKNAKQFEEPCSNEISNTSDNFEDKSEEFNDCIEANSQENISECIPSYTSQDEDEESRKEETQDSLKADSSSLIVDKPLNGDSQFSNHNELFCDGEIQKESELNEDQAIDRIETQPENAQNQFKDKDYEETKKEDSVISETVTGSVLSEDIFTEFTSTEAENQSHSELLQSVDESSKDKSSDQQFSSNISFDNQIISSESITTTDLTKSDTIPESPFETNFFMEMGEISQDNVEPDSAIDQNEFSFSVSKNDFQTANVDDDDFDDFADFSTYQQTDSTETSNNTHVFHEASSKSIVSTIENIDDDFGDFASSSFDTNFIEPCQSSATLEVSSKIEENPFPLLSEEQALDKAKKLFDELFPIPEVSYEDFISEEFEKNSEIFELLKDITDTPALSYRWPKSTSQKLLLKALNIDERNIVSTSNIYSFISL